MRAMVRRHVISQAGALLGAAGILLTAYLILAIDAAQRRFLPFDRNVREWVQPMRGAGLDLSMESVSLLGEPAGLIPLILIASMVLWRASRRWAVLLPILMAGTGALQLAGKWAADRPRPNAAPWGFPSGHVLSLVVFFGVMAFLLVTLSDRRRRLRVAAALSCAAVVGMVAVSRIYLDMHWLSDVIGGFILGTAYLLLALWVSQLIFGAPPVVDAADPVGVIGRAGDHADAAGLVRSDRNSRLMEVGT
jgi:membrane-associated phospholipid phosphatase